MHSRLVRVVEDENAESWGDWVADTVSTNMKKRWWGGYAPSSTQIKNAGNVVASAASGVAGLFKKSGTDQIKDVYLANATELTDVDGDSLVLGFVYAGHPLFKDRLIKADALHTYILKEQRAQIIRYFRHAVALKRLTIEIVSQSSGKVYAGGGWKAVSGSVSKESTEDQRRWFTVSYNNPQRDTTLDVENLYWMPYFSEILEATRNASGGEIETITSLNTSFGISAQAAKIVNIDANWIAQQSFLVRAEYA